MIRVCFGKEFLLEGHEVLINLLTLRKQLRRKFIADDVYSRFRVVDIMAEHLSFDRDYLIEYERMENLR